MLVIKVIAISGEIERANLLAAQTGILETVLWLKVVAPRSMAK